MKVSGIHVILPFLFFLPYYVLSCSDFLFNDPDPSVVVSGRTMDFSLDLKTVMEVIPRGTEFEELPIFNCSNCPQYKWKSKYGFVGANMVGLNAAADGLNEKGLSAAWLWLQDTKYPLPDTTDKRPMVSNLCSYILGNFGSIEEVKQGLKAIQPLEFDTELLEIVTHTNSDTKHYTLHIAVHDSNGNSLVVEFLKGKMNLIDNPNHVMTNAPPLEWHLTNLKIHKESSTSIPGDFSSASRFLRLSLFNNRASTPYEPNASYNTAEREQSSVARAMHMLNTVVRPPGFMDAHSYNMKYVGATQWDIIRDHKNRKLYYRSNMNEVVRLIDLSVFCLNSIKSRKEIPVNRGEWFNNVTSILLNEPTGSKTMDIPSKKTLQRIISSGLPRLPSSLYTRDTFYHNENTSGFFPGFILGVFISCGFLGFFVFRNSTNGYQHIA